MESPRRSKRIPVPNIRDDEIASFDTSELEEAIPPIGVLLEEFEKEENIDIQVCSSKATK